MNTSRLIDRREFLRLSVAAMICAAIADACSTVAPSTPPTPTTAPLAADLSERIDLHLRPDGQAEVTPNSAPHPQIPG